ncbi:MAG: hypothetical protein P4L40_05390 [Terracidiphilus sp.]|nr:hypothetical protein [Terracidiphilus sp.]
MCVCERERERVRERSVCVCVCVCVCAMLTLLPAMFDAVCPPAQPRGQGSLRCAH